MIRVAGEVTDGSAEGRGWGQHHDMLVGIQREEPVLPTLEALTAGAGLPPRDARPPRGNAPNCRNWRAVTPTERRS